MTLSLSLQAAEEMVEVALISLGASYEDFVRMFADMGAICNRTVCLAKAAAP